MQFQKRMRGHDRPEPARLPDPINAHARAHAARCGAAQRREGGCARSPGARNNPGGSLSGVETHCWFSPLMFALSCSIVTRCALSPPTPLRPMGVTHKARASHISRLIVSICRSSPLDDSSHWGESGHRTTDRFSKRTPRGVYRD